MKSYLPKNGSNVCVIIADCNITTDPIKIAENLNNFFTLKGKNLQKKILRKLLQII